MKLSRTSVSMGVAAVAICASQFAAADDSFWYIGGNIGQSRAKIDDARIANQLLGAGLASPSIANDDNHSAYKLFGGYQLNKNFALEASYFDLGQFGYTATTVPAGTLNGNIKLRGVGMDMVGILPLTQKFSAFGRLGMNYAQAQDSFSSTGSVASPTIPNPSKNALNYKAGLGLQYDVTKAFGLRAEAERYRIDDAVGNKGDINMISVGLVYRFDEKKPAPVQKEAPAPAPVVEAAPIFVIVPVIKLQRYCSILDIQFEIKQDEIQREEKEKLAVVGTFLNKYPDTTAVIEGHTDNVGSSEYNLKLSLRRAEAVVSYLVDTLHIAPARLSAVGYGEARPIADNSTREGQQMNRRIDAVIACATDVAGLKVVPARMTMALEMDFDPNKTDIQPQYYGELHEVANFMKANPDVTAAVEGHSSNMVGKVHISAEKSMEISSLRANKVMDYLVEKEGISRSRLSAEAYGRTRRVAYGTTLEGQQENRRVNIIFNYPKK
ncbi:OmpA family protein [Sideroxydans sp. CL21]|uniref:OmpA family protein n=1 Tax=Sideroxydans sp. CL21 TaxID=2600596 RepID=UPI0012A99BDB|nr:OmpA family protein [Sideroxydans sp. CL21]VVC83006.1 Outer membrane protein A precursor [Sideroxydans sp. CL21]